MGHIIKARYAADRGDRGADTDQVAAEVTQVLLSARLAADAERAAAKNAAVLLARKMAEKIVGRAVDLDPSAMADIASQALLASRPRGGAVVLRIHPDDLAAVVERKPSWLGNQDLPAEVRLVADASVGRYGCVVETVAGRLDARLQTQLEVLERVLCAPTPCAYR